MGLFDRVTGNLGFVGASLIQQTKQAIPILRGDIIRGVDVRKTLGGGRPLSTFSIFPTPTAQAAGPGQTPSNQDRNIDLSGITGLQTQTGGGGGGGGGGVIGQQAAFDSIQANFDANIRELSGIAGESRGGARLAEKGVRSQFGRAQGELGASRTDQLGTIEEAGVQVGESATSALSQARRLAGELGQQNIAQLSALGISDSSAALALQERLGRDVFAAVNNITQNRQRAENNLSRAKVSVEDFFTRQKASLEEGLALAVEKINFNLQSARRKVNEAKTLASAQKASARNQVIAGAQAAMQQAQAQVADFSNAQQVWKQTVDQIFNLIGGFTGGQVDLSNMMQGIATANESLQKSGVNAQINAPGILSFIAGSTSKLPSLFIRGSSGGGTSGGLTDEEKRILEGG